MQCKKICSQNIDKFISPIREKKNSLTDEYILEVLEKSKQKTSKIAKEKMKKIDKLIKG